MYHVAYITYITYIMLSAIFPFHADIDMRYEICAQIAQRALSVSVIMSVLYRYRCMPANIEYWILNIIYVNMQDARACKDACQASHTHAHPPLHKSQMKHACWQVAERTNTQTHGNRKRLRQCTFHGNLISWRRGWRREAFCCCYCYCCCCCCCCCCC